MKNFNLRDFGAGIWERANRPQRVAIALSSIFLISLLPFAGGSFLATPIAAYDAVLVYPVAIFVLMSLGLNIVVGKSGMLTLDTWLSSQSVRTQWASSELTPA